MQDPLIRLLIDTDTASDDAVALVCALRLPQVRVEAITVVAGNLAVEGGVQNALLALDAAQDTSPPVFAGAARPLKRPLKTSEFIHGADGMGELENRLPESGHAETEHAVDALIRLVRADPGELTLVTLGPLTNLALALAEEPGLAKLFKAVWVMGGQGWGPGNVTDHAEYNFFVDAEAAQAVLASGVHPVLVGWDCNTDATFFGADDMAALAGGSPLARSALRWQKTVIARNKGWGREGFQLADPLALLAAVLPGLVQDSRELFCQVDCHGDTYGRVTLAEPTPQVAANATVVRSVDGAAFKRAVLSLLALPTFAR